jgi:hypothetical protein
MTGDTWNKIKTLDRSGVAIGSNQKEWRAVSPVKSGGLKKTGDFCLLFFSVFSSSCLTKPMLHIYKRDGLKNKIHPRPRSGIW